MKTKTVTMWTVQSQRVIDTIQRDDIYYVKRRYLDEKYGETAWIFKTAYDFFIWHAQQIIPRPKEAESPVWMFRDRRWAVPDQNTKLLKLEIPKEEVILFDLRKWARILNLSYVGNQEETAVFEEKLKRAGIAVPSDVFEKPYYPVYKNEITRSWKKLFDEKNPEEIYIQGATWKIRKEWIAGCEF